MEHFLSLLLNTIYRLSMPLEIDKIYLSNELRKTRSLKVTDDNTDVIVKMLNGDVYIASFFSYDSLKTINAKNKEKNKFLAGKIFWFKNMLLVETCSKELIDIAVQYLITEQLFVKVFQKL